MLNTRAITHQTKLLKAAGLALGALVLVWTLSGWIVSGDLTNLVLGAVAAVGVAFVIFVLKDWRNGIYAFLIWLVFEDLIRKFAGNGTAMFFAKDALVGMTYIAMFIAYRRRQFPTFKPPFFVWLSIFFWFAIVQVFNPNSPSVLYGLLGMKTYFYYVPLMFAGYAMLRTEKDLHRILMVNMWIALVVSGLGVVQSVLGLTFLNPSTLDTDLEALGNDIRRTPISHLEVARTTSLYVSEGRFSQALILFFILAMGIAGYLLMRTKRGRKLVFPVLGVVVLATVMAGIRSSFIAVIVSAVVLTLGMIWGAPPFQMRQTFRIGKAIRLAVVFGVVGIGLMILLFPEAITARWAYYTETLSPGSSVSELGDRSWDYPVKAIQTVLSQPNWQWGNGIGTASLGVQYVGKLLGTPTLQIGAESGYATLLAELGVPGVILWEVWTLALLIYSWRVVRKLKGTRMFPLALAIFWYAIYILIFGTFYGLTAYQNYLTNAYLWLMVGVLFRLPGLLAEQKTQGTSTNPSQNVIRSPIEMRARA